MAGRDILLTPGPVPVPEPVRRALGEPIFHHRTPRYQKLFADVSERLKKVFRTSSPVYTITGSGTAAMEASLANFHHTGDEILVVEGGKFGERFTEIANAYGLKPVVIQVPWGEGVAPDEIGKALKKNPGIRSVCVQLCETSTAVLFDIEAIGKVVAGTDALLIVDAISGLSADRLETDDWHVDLAIGGSQKALSLPPGLGFLSVSEKAKARLGGANLPRYYLDLRLYEKALAGSDTPFTPAIGLVRALAASLDMIEAEGLENIWKRCSEYGHYTRGRLQEMGLEIYSKAPSAAVSAALVPEGINGAKLVKVMRDEKGVGMAGGQGAMKGKLIRIAHMGGITKADLETGIEVLAETIQEMSVKT